MLFASSAAWADCGANVVTGSGTVNIGPSPSNGQANWNGATNAVTFSAVAWTMPSPKCQTTYFDWGTGDGAHYDARAARSCQSAGGRTGSVSGEASTVNGMQKFGVCYADGNQQLNNTVCNDHAWSVCSVTSINSTPTVNKAVSWWLRSTTGSLTTVSGGDRRDANN